MKSQKAHAFPETPGRELYIVRTFKAPCQRVWEAWTDPEHLKHWWGPKEFTAPFSTIDLRIGGSYLHCMRSFDGQDYWSTGTYREIQAPGRLVYTDSFSDKDGNIVTAGHYGLEGDFPPEMLVTVTLEEKLGRTTMTLNHVGLPPGTMRTMAEDGWNQSFDKLAEFLAES